MEENIGYYKVRLEFIKKLFMNHETDLLQKNADKIKTLIEGYNRFKNHIDYDRTLAEFPEVFIFN